MIALPASFPTEKNNKESRHANTSNCSENVKIVRRNEWCDALFLVLLRNKSHLQRIHGIKTAFDVVWTRTRNVLFEQIMASV